MPGDSKVFFIFARRPGAMQQDRTGFSQLAISTDFRLPHYDDSSY